MTAADTEKDKDMSAGLAVTADVVLWEVAPEKEKRRKYYLWLRMISRVAERR